MKKAILRELIDFFESEEGYDKQDVIAGILGEIEQLKGYAADEIGLQWDNEDLGMVLQDFADQFYNKTIEGVCNVIESFLE